MRVSRERNRRRVAAGACLISLTAILKKKKCLYKHFFYAFEFFFRPPVFPAPARELPDLRRGDGDRSRGTVPFFFQTPCRS